MSLVMSEPPGPRPAVFDAAGDVWQRGLDGRWHSPWSRTGWTWHHLDATLGPLRTIPTPFEQAPYTDELPTIDFARALA